MRSLSKDIDMGLYFLLDNVGLEEIKDYNWCFRFSNEALNLYYPDFNLKGKCVLTVAGSGDQVLQAIKEGAKDIVAFDKNRFAYYLTALKLAAAQGLDFKDFYRFFTPFKEGELSESLFACFKDYLKEDAYQFWTTMYQEGYLEQRKNSLIRASLNRNLGEGSYLDEETFPLLKSQIANVKYKFIPGDINSLSLGANSKFDAIFLSNIFDWMVITENDYLEFLNSKFVPLMKENGKCALYVSPNVAPPTDLCFDNGVLPVTKKIYQPLDYPYPEVVYTYTKRK